MKEKEFAILLSGYLNDQLSPSDTDLFFKMVASNQYDAFINEHILVQLKAKENSYKVLSFDVADEIVRNIALSENFANQTLSKTAIIKRLLFFAVAACFLLFAASTVFFKGKFFFGVLDKNTTTVSTLKYKQNSTGKPEQVRLEDGTTVLLQPQSMIRYSVGGKDKREVFLEGNAFFDVAKNKNKPFFVYTGSLVTRVFGTSFDIFTANNGDAKVLVKSGKVQLYTRGSDHTNKEKLTEKNAEKLNPLIVLPNQMGVYTAKDNVIHTAVSENPILVKEHNGYISPDTEKIPFAFNGAKLSEVLKYLELHYGIEILVDNPELYNCLFTGDITQLDLFTKLKIICLTVNMNYEINGTKILITGSGCK